MTGIPSAGQPPILAIKSSDVPEAARGSGSDETAFADILAESRASRDETIRAHARAHSADERQHTEAAIERDAASRETPPSDPSLAHTDPDASRSTLSERRAPTREAAPQPSPSSAEPSRPNFTSEQRPASDTTGDQERGDHASRPPRDKSTRLDSADESRPANAPVPFGAGANAVAAPPTPSTANGQIVAAASALGGGGQNTGTPATASLANTARPATERATQPATAAASYRSTSASALKLTEQARESVFRQIAAHLNKDGTGDMRVWLQPRELGRIDVQVAIGEGNHAQLWIRTERPELGAMLEQHRGQLERALRDQGLTIDSSDIDYDADFTSNDPASTNGGPLFGDPSPDNSAAAFAGSGQEPTNHHDRDEQLRSEAAGIRIRTTDGFDFWA